jgi:SSS family solute:Na+ symporter
MIVALIGIFLLVYGLWYPLRGNLWNYITITGTIYLSSMSTLLVACCYWKKANNWGAAGAIILGAVMPVAYLIFEQIPRTREIFVEPFGPSASCIWGIFAYAGAAAAMVVGSLLKYKFKKVQ